MGLQELAYGLIGSLALANLSTLAVAFDIGQQYTSLMSYGILAYTFGLRHAVDADHIAAIDNVTRKLLSEDQKPLTVGLWFSLGHSTIVFIMCFVVSCWGSEAAAHRHGVEMGLDSEHGGLCLAAFLHWFSELLHGVQVVQNYGSVGAAAVR